MSMPEPLEHHSSDEESSWEVVKSHQTIKQEARKARIAMTDHV